MKVDFTKMSGAGNDFVVVDNRSKRIKDGRKAARILCDRRWGVGADGLLLLEKGKKGSYKMMYYNADGSYGGMCGNGGRCIASYAVLNKIAAKRHRFEALDHIYDAVVSQKEVVLSMKDPKDVQLGDEVSLKGRRLLVNSVDTGAPHVVVPVANLGGSLRLPDVDVVNLGREIRLNGKFSPAGTNVNFVERLGGNSIKIRTYERGVEDETLACGTGSIASAIVAMDLWKLKSPITVIPQSGIPLRVEFEMLGSSAVNVQLAGPATVVFTGTVEL